MKFTHKAAAAAGSLAALTVASQDVDAEIVYLDGSPLTVDFTIPNGTQVDWDVDGNFGRDFYLERTSFFSIDQIDLNSEGANGRGFVNGNGGGADDILNLPTGFVVGPTLAAGYFFGATDENARTVLEIDSSILLGDVDGFASGVPGFAGFAFDANGTTLYGWAELTLDTNAPGTITISEWAYEDSGAAIAVGDTGAAAIPEPHSLAMIAMGAAGVAAWRMRRKKTTEM